MNFSELVAPDGLFSDGDWIGKKDQDENGTVRLIQLADIGVCLFKDKSAKFVTEAKAQELNCTLLQKGDILVARLPDPLGRACIFPLDGKCITAVDVAIVRITRQDISPSYIMYMINSPGFRAKIKNFESGTTRKRISRKNLDKIQFDIPPLSDQESIVSRIEELFSQLDASVSELKTAKERLKAYRQAVLKEAFEEQKMWTAYRFADLMDSIKNGYGLKPSDDGPYRILKISAVRPMKLDITECRYNIQPFNEEYLIAENDLLFTRYNGSQDFVGVCACVPNLPVVYGYPDKLIKCIPKLKNKIHSKYLQYYMNQGDARKYIRSKIKTTSGQHGISGADLKKTVVYLPDINRQEEIVELIESRLSVCDSIEKTVDTALQQAEALRQSILKKAFEGR